MIWFTLLAAALGGGRLLWLGDYVRRCFTAAARRGSGKWEPVRTTTTSKLEGITGEDLHQMTIGLSERQLDTSLVGGSVALAAWTQLFVSSTGSRISGLSLSLLFAGALVLSSAPSLCRTEGVHLTYIGREAGSYGGFGLVILSLFSIVAGLSLSWFVDLLGVLAGAALVSRDGVEVFRHLQIQRKYSF